MKKFAGLLIASSLMMGCAAVAPPKAPAPPVPVDDAAPSAGDKLKAWIPGIFSNFYDIFGLNFGTAGGDYKLGAHLQFTKLVRAGVFDYSDFEVLGIHNAINGGSMSDFMKFDKGAGDYQVAATIGAGAGASASIDVWEALDWAITTVTLNQVSL